MPLGGAEVLGVIGTTASLIPRDSCATAAPHFFELVAARLAHVFGACGAGGEAGCEGTDRGAGGCGVGDEFTGKDTGVGLDG